MKIAPPTFAILLQDFFCKRLVAERNASTKTIAAYRDSFRLFIRFAAERLRKAPTSLTLADLEAALVLEFLHELETVRGNCARSRNARLAAIRSFVRYVSFRDPTSLPSAQRILAIPMKRFDRPLLGFLSREEVEAILDAPDRTTWSGDRDHAMLVTMYNTGARVSEIATMNVGDVSLAHRRAAHIRGKGRKERVIPLWQSTVDVLKRWVKIRGLPDAPLFPNRGGDRLTRSGIEDRLRAAVHKARDVCPTLLNKKVSPHTLRHTTLNHPLIKRRKVRA